MIHIYNGIALGNEKKKTEHRRASTRVFVLDEP